MTRMNLYFREPEAARLEALRQTLGVATLADVLRVSIGLMGTVLEEVVNTPDDPSRKIGSAEHLVPGDRLLFGSITDLAKVRS